MGVKIPPVPAGATRYFTGVPCKHGHIAERSTANGACVDCRKAFQRVRTARPDVKASRRQYDRQRWENNRDYLNWKNRRYYAENSASVNAQKREYWATHKDEMSAASKRWKSENLHRIRALSAKRKAATLLATPPWADLEAILAVYEDAARIQRETGIAHHVDHIVPLQGKSVCGLHVAWNLRPLPAKENIRKGNRHDP